MQTYDVVARLTDANARLYWIWIATDAMKKLHCISEHIANEEIQYQNCHDVKADSVVVCVYTALYFSIELTSIYHSYDRSYTWLS